MQQRILPGFVTLYVIAHQSGQFAYTMQGWNWIMANNTMAGDS